MQLRERDQGVGCNVRLPCHRDKIITAKRSTLSVTRTAREVTTRLVLPPSLMRKNNPLKRLKITASMRKTIRALSIKTSLVFVLIAARFTIADHD
jgi:hypothetical protein